MTTGPFLTRGKLNGAGDLLSDHRSHRSGEKVEIHYREPKGMAVNFAVPVMTASFMPVSS